jgi:hypothetical protein
MFKIKWTYKSKSDLCYAGGKVRKYKTEKAAERAIEKFYKGAPEGLVYEVVK